jgi:hypothetical protein
LAEAFRGDIFGMSPMFSMARSHAGVAAHAINPAPDCAKKRRRDVLIV